MFVGKRAREPTLLVYVDVTHLYLFPQGLDGNGISRNYVLLTQSSLILLHLTLSSL